MVEHERTDTTPDTDQIPVQTPIQVQPTQPEVTPRTEVTTQPEVVSPPVVQAYAKTSRTRFSGLWVGLTVAAVVLLVLLVFIIQNGQSANISFFGAHLHLPLGVALLLAAICGVLLVAVPGYGRILQLRKAMRRAASEEGHR